VSIYFGMSNYTRLEYLKEIARLLSEKQKYIQKIALNPSKESMYKNQIDKIEVKKIK